MSAIAGCKPLWKAIYASYGVLGISVLPMAIWCSYKHIKYQSTTSSNKLLYRLSIAVYLCTIIGSIFTGITSFAGCYMSSQLWFLLWYIQCIAWVLQWFFFIWLLFSRVKIVFDGSAYKLSRVTIFSFWTIYLSAIILGSLALIGLIVGHLWIYVVAYALALLLALILAIYLPALFIYKLFQINSKVQKSQAETSMNNTMTKQSSVGRVTRRTTDINGDNAILTVIRKCTILTIFSLLSTWSIFICVMITIFGTLNTGILIFWGYALTLDAVANFMCVMLSNSFCDDYYIKWCGCIDSCVGKCCFKDNDRLRISSMSPKSAEKELSSWMEETSHTPNTETCTKASNNKVNETNDNV